MDKNSTEILREIEADIASLKDRLRDLEEKVAQYQLSSAAGEEAPEAPVDFTDMEIGVVDLPAEEVPAAEVPAQEEDLPVFGEEEEGPVAAAAPDPAPAATPGPALEPEPVAEATPVQEPVPEPEAAPAPVEPVDTSRMPWRLDKPGATVKNIRSGISLYDRALFIGTLFKEDYALYDKTIGELNAMAGLDEAVDYILAAFPDWNLKSDIVYSFIMAVRKKLG
ncbi:MAG: hypothetical protein IJ721_07790 [Bacteroidales bacterium]|nr:hypothetical protein [Bacteroidales bacterium]